jgi:hypothetical protein
MDTYNSMFGGMMPGETEISFKDHLVQCLTCFDEWYKGMECTGDGTWADDFLFKRNVLTAGVLFIDRKEMTRGNVQIKNTTCNENFEITPSSPGKIAYSPRVDHQQFDAAIIVTRRYKKWANTAYFNECVDFLESTIADVLMTWDETMTKWLFDMLQYGEYEDTRTALWTTGNKPNTPVYGLGGERALFGTHTYGQETVSNLVVASTIQTGGLYTYVPFVNMYDASGANVAANPRASGLYGRRTLKVVDLEYATYVHQHNNATNIFDGRRFKCGCKEFYLYKNCEDTVEKLIATNPTGTTFIPQEALNMAFESCPGVRVICRETDFIKHGEAYLVSSNHDMFYGEVFAPEIRYINESDYSLNSEKDGIKFTWTVLYGVFTPRGFTKIVF